jgi:hypothetical protein
MLVALVTGSLQGVGKHDVLRVEEHDGSIVLSALATSGSGFQTETNTYLYVGGRCVN